MEDLVIAKNPTVGKSKDRKNGKKTGRLANIAAAKDPAVVKNLAVVKNGGRKYIKQPDGLDLIVIEDLAIENLIIKDLVIENSDKANPEDKSREDVERIARPNIAMQDSEAENLVVKNQIVVIE